jgi:hypothetical protein
MKRSIEKETRHKQNRENQEIYLNNNNNNNRV